MICRALIAIVKPSVGSQNETKQDYYWIPDFLFSNTQYTCNIPFFRSIYKKKEKLNFNYYELISQEHGHVHFWFYLT